MENEIIQQLEVIAKNIQALAEPKFIEYIALIFSFIGIIVSGVAIWFAVQVPKKIADRQDNIALFEKRYQCFQLFEDCISLYKGIENKNNIQDLKKECYFMLGKLEIEDIELSTIYKKVEEFEFILHQMHFLFPEISENDLCDLYRTLQRFIVTVVLTKKDKDMDIENKDSIDVKKQAYLDTVNKFSSKYSDIIWGYMKV